MDINECHCKNINLQIYIEKVDTPKQFKQHASLTKHTNVHMYT